MDAQTGGILKAAENKPKVFYSSAEVIELGILYSDEPPSPAECKYCGKTLYYEAVVFAGRVVAWNRKYPQRCTCDCARAFWEQYDAEQARKKEEENDAKKKAIEAARIERLISRAGIKKRFASRTFDNYILTSKNQKAFEIALNYAEHFSDYAAKGQGIYFEGTYGTGKTHLAVSIAQRVLKNGFSVIFRTSFDLLADIKRAYDEDSGIGEYEAIEIFKSADLLVIDDLGKEQCTEWAIAVLTAIINDRYENMKPTIITTNYSEDMLINRLTPRNCDNLNIKAIVSRLHECTLCVTMAWEDYRGVVNE